MDSRVTMLKRRRTLSSLTSSERFIVHSKLTRPTGGVGARLWLLSFLGCHPPECLDFRCGVPGGSLPDAASDAFFTATAARITCATKRRNSEKTSCTSFGSSRSSRFSTSLIQLHFKVSPQRLRREELRRIGYLLHHVHCGQFPAPIGTSYVRVGRAITVRWRQCSTRWC